MGLGLGLGLGMGLAHQFGSPSGASAPVWSGAAICAPNRLPRATGAQGRRRGVEHLLAREAPRPHRLEVDGLQAGVDLT